MVIIIDKKQYKRMKKKLMKQRENLQIVYKFPTKFSVLALPFSTTFE